MAALYFVATAKRDLLDRAMAAADNCTRRSEGPIRAFRRRARRDQLRAAVRATQNKKYLDLAKHIDIRGLEKSFDEIDVATGVRTKVRDLSGADPAGVMTFGAVQYRAHGLR